MQTFPVRKCRAIRRCASVSLAHIGSNGGIFLTRRVRLYVKHHMTGSAMGRCQGGPVVVQGGAQLHEVAGAGTRNSLKTAFHPHLAYDVADVPLDGAHGHNEFPGNRLIGVARRQQP